MSKINILDDLQNQPNEKIEAIKKILPDCFDIDGNLITEKLHEILINNFQTPETERFTFNWAGKQKAREVAYKTYTEGTLKFDKTKSKNFDQTKNLIIEGDNLQVLKLLKNSYKGKVKCIYIDPPYNTGNDFVYNDKFELDIQKYLIETGEIDQETGEQLTDYIQKEDGKKHSKWLSFMYPRLMMAREMLRDDGVIFVSIDDNEVHHLRLVMNEIFGEGCVETFVWRKSGIGRDGKMKNTATFRNDHEYIFVGYKDVKELNKSFEKPNFENEGSNPDNDPRGNWMSGSISRTEEASKQNHSNYYTVISPTGVSFTRQFDVSKEEFEKLNKDNRISWGESNSNVPRIKVFTDEERNVTTSSLIDYKDMTTTLGGKQLEEILQVEGIGNEVRPKPIALIKKLIQISTAPGDLILDFFAGSGTTGQAVMELNQEEFDKQAKDGLLANKEAVVGDRKFILVQLPEKIDAKKEAFKAGYEKISDITIARVKKASEKYQNVDNGFKVLKLVDNPNQENLFNLKNIDDNLFIITHLALFYGYGLNYQATKIAEKEIYLMKSEIEKTKDAIIILEKTLLTMQDIMLLVKNYGTERYKFFSCDSALNIELTYNLLQHFQERNVVVF